MRYHNQYFEEYTRITDVKENWMNQMIWWKRWLNKSFPYIMGVFWGGLAVLFLRFIALEMVVFATVIVGVPPMLLLAWQIGKMNSKARQEVAVKDGYADWNEKHKANQEKFKKFLREEKEIIKSTQIDYLIKDIEKYHERNKINFEVIGGSIVVIYGVPVWNQFLGTAFKTAGPTGAVSLLIIFSLVVFLIWIIVVVIRQFLRDTNETKMMKVNEMKELLVEMYVDALGRE